MIKRISKELSLKFLLGVGAVSLFLFSKAEAQTPVTKTVKLENPLEVNSIEELLLAILNVLMVLAIPVIVFFIIYAGFLYVTAQGNAQQVQQATRALTYAVIGGVLILGAFAIAEIVKNIIGAF